LGNCIIWHINYFEILVLRIIKMEHDHHLVFKNFLVKTGLKYTSQRKEIVDRVFDIHHHFEIEELITVLRNSNIKIARATVYSTIKLLMEVDLVKKIRLNNNEVVYEHVFGHEHHDHLICLDCNHVIETHDDEIEMLQDKLCSKHGFQLSSHVHTMYVKCNQLKAQGSCSIKDSRQ